DDRRPDDEAAEGADERARGRHRAHRGSEGAARRQGLRPGDGRPSAPPRDPALHRGSARGLRPWPLAQAGLDDHGRPQGRRRGRHLGHRPARRARAREGHGSARGACGRRGRRRAARRRITFSRAGKNRHNACHEGELMQATIKEKREVAKGTLFVTFDLGGEDVEFEPGQYFWVELLDPPYDDEKGPRRHITVVTSPTEKGVLGLATRIRDSENALLRRRRYDGDEPAGAL